MYSFEVKLHQQKILKRVPVHNISANEVKSDLSIQKMIKFIWIEPIQCFES